MPIDATFEKLADLLDAKHEPEPLPPLPVAKVKGRGGVPEEAIAKLQKIAEQGPRAPVNPFGANVEVSDE